MRKNNALQEEQTSLEKNYRRKENNLLDVKQFLSVVRKYTNLTELTQKLYMSLSTKIIVHAPDEATVNAYRKLKLSTSYRNNFIFKG